MSIGSTGITGSVAGSHLAQTQGSEVSRAQQESSDHARQAGSAERAEDASGIGQTEQDEETSDRDADGRRLWEASAQSEDVAAEDEQTSPRRSKDPSGQSGASWISAVESRPHQARRMGGRFVEQHSSSPNFNLKRGNAIHKDPSLTLRVKQT